MDNPNPLYWCDQCGKADRWNTGWSHWGSAENELLGKQIVVCSDECKAKIDMKETWFKKYNERLEA